MDINYVDNCVFSVIHCCPLLHKKLFKEELEQRTSYNLFGIKPLELLFHGCEIFTLYAKVL